ncbi:methylated-DNA--[protein]-cysteine S-methyltransferase [Chondromyces apiculatus]|uniref:Methylated-DNA-(Protein)-cysteine S-methyltransferase n=1 Tax=Chondromyces apiculatus DSM 436 TaxID=1192034 RepID=A0A017SXR7_9BACT|nr:methylated-DNA--[protein]-cysteine S-methyltransferase [Chondromyces apiculatus]EYF01768.1 methylated-DNA-(protein)-cysteine S-methyltransferase [Chondromyces apiculatus DSM 436]
MKVALHEQGTRVVGTAFGACRIGWSALGLTRVRLLAEKEREAEAASAAEERAAGDGAGLTAGDGAELPEREDMPAFVQEAVALLVRHLGGEPQDLSGIPLDMRGLPDFHRQAYEAARRVEPGCTIGYGELAAVLGAQGAARAVGQAMARNPFVVVVPCHRVLAAGRRPGGFSAPGGLDTKARLLALEGAALPPRQLSLLG